MDAYMKALTGCPGNLLEQDEDCGQGVAENDAVTD
jgi:hypothetical protein